MTALLTILDRALSGHDLLPQEGLQLLTQIEPEAIAAIGAAANQLRLEQVGETVTYVVNRNINFTNICEQHCNFCAFRRDEGQPGAYWLSPEQIRAKAAEAVQQGATEICMQGGLHVGAKLNGRSLDYYRQLVHTLKETFPQLHLHAFSPQEVQFIAREDGLSFAEVITALHEAGVDSMPGTAAEVLHDSVRKILCPEKIDSATWLEIVGTGHRLGLPSTSTLLSGHIETPEHQIHHLEALRQLQQQSLRHSETAITEFILLPYIGQDAPPALRKRVGRDQPVLKDALLLTAVARLYLGRWIVNHQPSWVKLGLTGATEALRWGCNDIGGTLMEEHITSMAGAQGGTCQSAAQLQAAIHSLGRPAVQRDTLYRRLSTPTVAPLSVAV
ncbi:7,8-didemethyl-8-hydroxy-5-deazariboflavin synthase subunit CofH [Leptolyngbya sp. FACHB-261]|uniref:7,8-didemethyl-8-hydroxy-5-deazariboflavin synthase subunit CofH n=1 Tax=Leptolyngbya sp. FACHB-261 TaxID=2692806 RepID=UPI001682C506|nr:7,8-didemethyl-8-hydroxy-5-deazariboflavin synthase subunit CofH [Leptolyngbya sp. FACHB-261]MBD2102021.1 7,8-didemethyl-8-hydroxy-5-deazariboflavin synthase subunit CofH [Leptolyngbya sp. FACHB-261]